MALFDRFDPKEKLLSGVLGAFSVDEIKWEPASDAEASVIVHKIEDEDFPDGSNLTVGPDQMAVFTDGTNVTAFVGPCKIRLDTGDARFAPFRKVSHKLIGKADAFHSSVYFVDTTCLAELKWGTPTPIMVRLPVEGVDVHVKTCGLFGAHIEAGDAERAAEQVGKLLRNVVGDRSDLGRDELVSIMRSKIQEKVAEGLNEGLSCKNIKMVQIPMYSSYFAETISQSLQGRFDEFGMTLDKFTLMRIDISKEDLRMIQEAEKKRVLDEIQRKKEQSKAETACPSCGSPLLPGAKFCAECGTKI